MRLNDMTIRVKLAAALGVLGILVVLVAVLSLKSLRAASARLDDPMKGVSAHALIAEELRTAVDRRASALRKMVLVPVAQNHAADHAAVRNAHRNVAESLARLHQFLAQDNADKARGLVDEIDKVEQVYGPLVLATAGLATSGQHDLAIATMNNECSPLLAALFKASDDYRIDAERRSRLLADEAATAYAVQRNLLILACAVAMAAASLAGVLIVRSLQEPWVSRRPDWLVL